MKILSTKKPFVFSHQADTNRRRKVENIRAKLWKKNYS